MGLAKGPLSTLLDGFGNSFDQCSLLAALLRQAGFTANYEVGQIQLNQTQLNAWLGTTDTNIYTPYYVLANSGVPVTVIGTFPNQQLVLSQTTDLQRASEPQQMNAPPILYVIGIDLLCLAQEDWQRSLQLPKSPNEKHWFSSNKHQKPLTQLTLCTRDHFGLP